MRNQAYYQVYENGRKLCQTGTESDARMMCDYGTESKIRSWIKILCNSNEVSNA